MTALSNAFSQYSTMNRHLDGETNVNKPQPTLKDSQNFSIAVGTPQGLLVPLIKDVQDHPIVSLTAEIQRISNLGKDERLRVEDFQGTTFTISNIRRISG
jgi:2-oxoisovalerate dehydrogenase E2 component (dihydrolipoyl transacylase)